MCAEIDPLSKVSPSSRYRLRAGGELGSAPNSSVEPTLQTDKAALKELFGLR